jgi:RTX calcium-binding nonapeptide repeat (4 copies)
MRKLAIMIGMVMLLVIVAAGAAMAVTRTCNGIPCEGTNNDDFLHERTDARKDAIFGEKGEDELDANNRFRDRDRLFGQDQGDKLLANDLDGRDVLKGGAGRDRCYGDPGDRFRNCEVVRRIGPDAAAEDFAADGF